MGSITSVCTSKTNARNKQKNKQAKISWQQRIGGWGEIINQATLQI